MPTKKLFSLVLFFLVVAFFPGCSSVNKKYYVEVKDRVDQDLYGNAGFLSGKPPEGYQTGYKKTRKVYVVEMTKKPQEDKILEKKTEVVKEEANVSTSVERVEEIPLYQEPPPPPAPVVEPPHLTAEERRTILQIDQNQFEPEEVSREEESEPAPAMVEETEAVSSNETLPTEYTVQENETLQTISKKFYGSYSKWPQIYEANKEKITNPNRIKKGMVLTIPEI